MTAPKDPKQPIWNTKAQNKKLQRIKHTIIKLTHIISHKEIIGFGSFPSDPEQLDEIVELPMNISAHRDRTLHRLHIPFLDQNWLRLLA